LLICASVGLTGAWSRRPLVGHIRASGNVGTASDAVGGRRRLLQCTDEHKNASRQTLPFRSTGENGVNAAPARVRGEPAFAHGECTAPSWLDPVESEPCSQFATLLNSPPILRLRMCEEVSRTCEQTRDTTKRSGRPYLIVPMLAIVNQHFTDWDDLSTRGSKGEQPPIMMSNGCWERKCSLGQSAIARHRAAWNKIVQQRRNSCSLRWVTQACT
jgi:hypothetical protein